MRQVGTPDCARSDQNCTLPPPSSVPESAKHDELWIVKDTAKDAVLGVHGELLFFCERGCFPAFQAFKLIRVSKLSSRPPLTLPL